MGGKGTGKGGNGVRNEMVRVMEGVWREGVEGELNEINVLGWSARTNRRYSLREGRWRGAVSVAIYLGEIERRTTGSHIALLCGQQNTTALRVPR